MSMAETQPTTRICPWCRLEQPLSAYRANGGHPSTRRRPVCRTCENESRKDYPMQEVNLPSMKEPPIFRSIEERATGLIGLGFTDEVISNLLGVSAGTIRTYRNEMKKRGVVA